ncbi:MAG: sensor histidine kinase [Hellea sp.]
MAHAQLAENTKTSVIELKANSGAGWVNDSVSFYLETDQPIEPDEIITPPFSNKFKRLNTQMPEFGYFDKGIWLRISVSNQTSEPLSQLLIMHANFMPEMDVYFVTDSSQNHILHQNRQSGFKSRPIKYHQLVAPFTISAYDRGDIYIRYKSEGITSLPVSLETPVSFAETTNKRVTIDFIFYGIMAMFILASLLGRIFWRNPTFITYAFYAASVLFYIFQRDGYSFQYLWPGAPVWNNFSSLPIGASTVIFAAFFTRTYLDSNRLHHNIDKFLIGIVIIQLSVIGSAWIIGGSEAKQLAVMTTTFSILILFSIGVTAYLNYGRRALFFVIGWFGILFASVTMTLVHWSPLDFLRSESLDLMRMAFVFDAFMLGLASVVSVVEIQKDREKLVSEQMDALSTNLDLHTRLGRLEQKYNFMQNFAERASQRVVDTKHDLRQPLFALRSALSEFSETGKSAKSRDEIEESLTYIEGMVETVLEEALEQGEVPAPREEDGAERVEVDKLFASLLTMFRNDAEKNAVTLKALPCGQSIYAPPFPVLRILSNFIQNAIRYAPGARITISAKRQGDHLSLEVHDTGPGMDAAELAAVKVRYQRGEVADDEGADKGLGLGLSIVEKLVKENHLEWTITSNKHRGTVAKLRVPTAE